MKFAAMSYVALTAYARCSSAVSEEAQAGQAAASNVVQSAEKSQALFGERSAVISKLHQLSIECSAPNWDGNGAEPLDALAVMTAEALLRVVPASVGLPEVAPDPDGQISLDWMQSRTRLFSISVGKTGRLAYSWVDGADKGFAVTRFDYRGFPAKIFEGLNSLVGDATVRPT